MMMTRKNDFESNYDIFRSVSDIFCGILMTFSASFDQWNTWFYDSK